MRNLLLFLFLLAACISARAQAICGFDVIHHKKMATDPVYRKAVEENEKAVQGYLSKNKSKLSARTSGTNTFLYTIPVVVHIVEDVESAGRINSPSDAQVEDAINYLNEVYNGSYPGTQGIGDLQLQFVLAVKDPFCNSTTGIERVDASAIPGYATDGVSSDPGKTPGVDQLTIKDLSRWNPFQYYNIWVVNKIDGKDGTYGTFVAGFAALPEVSDPSNDGMIILASQMTAGQKTLPHEIGHAFGLYHTFEGSTDRNSCPVNTNCNIDGDKVCDTDPESFNQLNGLFDFSCRTGTNSCTMTAYSVNTESNYMNYTNCYNLFTAGQKARMLAYAASVYRRSLTTSLASGSTYPLTTYSQAIAPTCTPTTSPTGLSSGFAGLIGIDLNNRSIASSFANRDNGYVDGTISCLNLIQITKGTNYTITATVAGTNEEQLRAWIDFNNDGVFDNNTELILFANAISRVSPTVSASFTVPATARVNTVLRLRVIDDLSTLYGVPLISSGCTNPTYGQAEDYPVYILSNGTLPVTLNAFKAELKNKAAFLSWNTSMEENLKGFDIEKATDGSNFTKIGEVSAKNHPSSSNDYHYTDRNLSENNYYRLRTNENTGEGKLSKIVFLHYNDRREKLWLVNNPFTNYIEIACTKAGSPAKLQLVNSVGIVVAEKMLTTNSGQIKWDLQTGLSSGTYIVRAFAYGETYTYKVIKQ